MLKKLFSSYRCKKTYEANECGRTLDALTDLTGGVCEFYTPDINPPENLFHVLYKSCVNRSQIVCWRNDKLLTPTGFIRPEQEDDSTETVSHTCVFGYSIVEHSPKNHLSKLTVSIISRNQHVYIYFSKISYHLNEKILDL